MAEAVELVTEEIRATLRRLLDHGDREAETLQALALELGVQREELPAPAEDLVERSVWHPVARWCVVTALRRLLSQVDSEEEHVLPEGIVQETIRACATEESSAELALSLDDLRLCLAATRKVFMGDLFRELTPHAANRRVYDIQRVVPGLSVRVHAPAAERGIG